MLLAGPVPEAKAKLRDVLHDKDDGMAAINSGVTVREAVEDWLTFGLPRRSAATVNKYRLMAA